MDWLCLPGSNKPKDGEHLKWKALTEWGKTRALHPLETVRLPLEESLLCRVYDVEGTERSRTIGTGLRMK